MSAKRQPAIFLSHGGGPCFWIEMPPPLGPHGFDGLRSYLSGLVASLPERPRAFVVVSGHWEAPGFTVSTAAHPGMLFDYYGFPPHTYELSYPAPGDPALAERIAGLLTDAGLAPRTDSARGFDHGVFVPFLIVDPEARIPVVMLSLDAALDPARHIALGAALAPLRDEGVVIVGSGNSYHNLREFGDGKPEAARVFDDWLQAAATAPDPAARAAALEHWTEAPAARKSHPREEHLIPLMAVVGAAGDDPGRVDFHDVIGGKAISGFRYG